VFSRLGFGLVALLITSATGCSTSDQSKPPAPPSAPVTLKFDDKDVALGDPVKCLCTGGSLLVYAPIANTKGDVVADIGIADLTAHSIGVSGLDGDNKYFWETTSTMGEPMTVTKTDNTFTVRGKIHQTTDAHVKKNIEITAANCPGTSGAGAS
jgi:hypothetical protein